MIKPLSVCNHSYYPHNDQLHRCQLASGDEDCRHIRNTTHIQNCSTPAGSQQAGSTAHPTPKTTHIGCTRTCTWTSHAPCMRFLMHTFFSMYSHTSAPWLMGLKHTSQQAQGVGFDDASAESNAGKVGWSHVRMSCFADDMLNILLHHAGLCMAHPMPPCIVAPVTTDMHSHSATAVMSHSMLVSGAVTCTCISCCYAAAVVPAMAHTARPSRATSCTRH